MLDDQEFQYYYILADGIYKDCPVLLKTIPGAKSDPSVALKKKAFAKAQESERKASECGFGVFKVSHDEPPRSSLTYPPLSHM